MIVPEMTKGLWVAVGVLAIGLPSKAFGVSSAATDSNPPPAGLSSSRADDPGLGAGGPMSAGARNAASSPASLASLEWSVAYFSHEFGLGDSATDIVFFGTRVSARSAVSGSLLYSSARNFVETDGSGAPVKKWNTGEFVFTVGYAERPRAWLSAGVNGKAFGMSAFGTRWMGLAFDAGAEVNFEGGVRATAALVNAGWQSSSNGSSDTLMPEVAAGIAVARSMDSVALAGQIQVRRSAGGAGDAELVLATEARVLSAVSVRLAYRPLTAYGPLAAGLGLAAGAYALDYSYAPLGAIGSLQRVGLSARFSALRRS